MPKGNQPIVNTDQNINNYMTGGTGPQGFAKFDDPYRINMRTTSYGPDTGYQQQAMRPNS